MSGINFNSTTNKAVTENGTQSLTNKTVNGVTLRTDAGASAWLNGTGAYSTPPGGGDMTAAVYDPQAIGSDAFARSNHTGTQAISTVAELQAELDAKMDTLANSFAFNSLADVLAYATPNVNNEIELCPSGDATFFIGAEVLDISPYTFIATNGAPQIYGTHKRGSQITTGSANPLFRIEGNPLFTNDIQLANTIGDLFEFNGNGFTSCTLDNTVFRACDYIGTFSGCLTLSLRTVTIVSTSTGGMTLAGSQGQFNMTNCVSGEFVVGAGWNGTLIDFGTSTWDLISIPSNNRFYSSVGNTVLAGDSIGTANLKVGGAGIVSNNEFFGDGTYLSGWTTQDSGFVYSSNAGLSDTAYNGYITLTGNATPTTIVSANAPVKITATTWATQFDNFFTATTDGRLTYTGLEDRLFSVTARCSVEPTSGGNINLSAYAAINSNELSYTKASARASAGSPSSITVVAQYLFSTGDYIELFIENNDTTADIIASTATISVRG